jgi:hypothetical protein
LSDSLDELRKRWLGKADLRFAGESRCEPGPRTRAPPAALGRSLATRAGSQGVARHELHESRERDFKTRDHHFDPPSVSVLATRPRGATERLRPESERLAGAFEQQLGGRSQRAGGALMVGSGVEVLEQSADQGGDRGRQRGGVGMAVGAQSGTRWSAASQ